MAELLRGYLKTIRAFICSRKTSMAYGLMCIQHGRESLLTDGLREAMRSRLTPMKNAAKMIRRHKPLILNWFKARNHLSSGVVEGLNNRIKVTVKKSYGFRTFNVLQIALFHDLAKLPIPPPPHTF